MNLAKRKKWEQHVADYERSGQSQNAWCRDNNIKVNRLRYWIKKFENEKTAANQTSLFNETEQEADLKKPEPALEEITYKRRKKVGKRDEMLKDLPVEVVEYRLTEDEQTCSKCGEDLHEMSKEVRRELKVIPAQAKVVEHVRHVYACRNCEKNDITTPIVTAKMPAPVLPGSFVSPSLMAYVMHQKYVLALPLYRQEQEF